MTRVSLSNGIIVNKDQVVYLNISTKPGNSEPSYYVHFSNGTVLEITQSDYAKLQ